MQINLLEANILENYERGPRKVFEGVKAWLQSRGVDVVTPDIIEITDRKSKLDEQTTISQSELQKLRAFKAELNALYAEGVENWDGYEIAMEMLNE